MKANVVSLGGGWHNLDLWVEFIDPKNPLSGEVTFYLHDSFVPDNITVPVKNGIAKVKGLRCYEAFTVGATCDNNTTTLELDLNEVPGFPKGFYYTN